MKFKTIGIRHSTTTTVRSSLQVECYSHPIHTSHSTPMEFYHALRPPVKLLVLRMHRTLRLAPHTILHLFTYMVHFIDSVTLRYSSSGDPSNVYSRDLDLLSHQASTLDMPKSPCVLLKSSSPIRLYTYIKTQNRAKLKLFD